MIHLPKFLTARNLGETLAATYAISVNEGPSVEVDASGLVFVDPFGLSALAAACERVGQDQRRIEITAIHPAFGAYLERMDLFRQPWIVCPQVAPGGRHDQRGSLVELRHLTAVAQVDRTAADLASALLGQVPHLDEAAPRDEMTGFNEWESAHQPLCHVFTELLQNSLTHARRGGYRNSNVWVCAQYYSRRDRICVGIVDNGCGFLGSLLHHPRLTARRHDLAILLALQPRVSCNRDLGLAGPSYGTVNAGIGLTTTYRIARESHGSMAIVSGDACVWAGNRREARPADAALPFWQGAALYLELPRSNLTRLKLRDLMPPREIGRQPPPIRFG